MCPSTWSYASLVWLVHNSAVWITGEQFTCQVRNVKPWYPFLGASAYASFTWLVSTVPQARKAKQLLLSWLKSSVSRANMGCFIPLLGENLHSSEASHRLIYYHLCRMPFCQNTWVSNFGFNYTETLCMAEEISFCFFGREQSRVVMLSY